MYMELTPQDTIKDLQRLLIDAIPGFEFPRKNLYDYNINIQMVDEANIEDGDFIIGNLWNLIEDPNVSPMISNFIHNNPNIDEDKPEQFMGKFLIERSSFTNELTSEEIEILAILMMIGWLQRQTTSIENTRMKYSGSDFKMTSQANHLSKLQSLLNECQRQSHHMQRLYKRRAITDNGLYHSTWDWFGRHGTTNIR